MEKREQEQVKKQKGKSSVLKQTSTSSVRLPADSVLEEVLNPLACVFVLSTVDKRRQAGSEKWLVNMSSIFASIMTVPVAAATSFLTKFLYAFFKDELGQFCHVVKQQHATGDEWNSADEGAGGLNAERRRWERRR